MGKRRADADSRRFLDEFEKVRISRFRAMGVVDPARAEALIPFPGGRTKLLAVKHTKFPNGGGWSFFVCPGCARRSANLYLIEDKPLCWKCCNAMNIQRRSKYGFGRATRQEVADRNLDRLIAKLETTERLRLKPTPPSWAGRAQAVYNSRRLSERRRRAMISLRLEQLANQQDRERSQGNARIKTYQPLADARSIINVQPIWRASTAERLQQALDKAQRQIIKALDSHDPEIQASAARLMLRTKQARDREIVYKPYQ